MKTITCIVTGMMLVFLTAGFAFSKEKTIVTEGISVTSKADAIRQAQRAAVEQGVGVFIHSETETANYVLQKDKILARTKGYVTSYKILEESSKKNDYFVKIKATVSLDKIKDDLMAMKILLESMERPKLMVLIEEDYIDMKKPMMRIAETEINSRLAAKGFELVDKAQVEKVKEQNKARQALAGNINAASSLGLMFGAQYVVIGNILQVSEIEKVQTQIRNRLKEQFDAEFGESIYEHAEPQFQRMIYRVRNDCWHHDIEHFFPLEFD